MVRASASSSSTRKILNLKRAAAAAAKIGWGSRFCSAAGEVGALHGHLRVLVNQPEVFRPNGSPGKVRRTHRRLADCGRIAGEQFAECLQLGERLLSEGLGIPAVNRRILPDDNSWIVPSKRASATCGSRAKSVGMGAPASMAAGAARKGVPPPASVSSRRQRHSPQSAEVANSCGSGAGSASPSAASNDHAAKEFQLVPANSRDHARSSGR